MATAKCTECDSEVTEESEALQCHICDEWTHIVCCDVSASMYEELTVKTRRGLSHICEKCIPKIELLRLLIDKPPLTPSTVKKVQRNPDNLSDSCAVCPTPTLAVTDLDTPIKKTRSKKKEKVSVEASKNKKCAKPQKMQIEIAGTEKTVPPESGTNLDNVAVDGENEISADLWVTVTKKQPGTDKKISSGSTGSLQQVSSKDKVHSRERSIIIINAPESQKQSSKERMDHDEEFLSKCVSKLFDESEAGVRVLLAFRLGKKNDNVESNPRPLKIILESETECQRVLSRTHRLKGESYYLVRDLCPDDRLKLKEAVSEIKRRRLQGETNLKIVDFRVVSKTPRARWKPVVLIPTKLETQTTSP